MDLRDKFWMWGYTQEQIGTSLPFIGTLKSYCSLETAASYLNMPNTVFMNSMHSWDRVEENLALVKNSSRVICGLPHGKEAVIEGARRISELSVKFPNIKGVVLDDFLQMSGHPTTVEMVREVKQQLRSVNPELELYVVMYSDINHLDVTEYMPYIDGIIFWRWCSTEQFWKCDFGMLIHKWKVTTGKKIFHGLYLQDYADSGSSACPLNMELWKLQWKEVLKVLRSGDSMLDGCVVLQNGFMSDFHFRDQLVWLKDTLDWYLGTFTSR